MASIYTYEDYTKEPNHLSLEQMGAIHRRMIYTLGNDPETNECYRDILIVATKYANIRAYWVTMDKREKMERDDLRTSLHDSFITKLNMLSRLFNMQGKDTSWRDDLGYDTEGYGRKAIGDFACYLAFVAGLNAR